MRHCLDKRIGLCLVLTALVAGSPKGLGQTAAGARFTPRGEAAYGYERGSAAYGYNALTVGQYNSVGAALQSSIQDPLYTSRALSRRARPDGDMADLRRPSPMMQGAGPGRRSEAEDVIGPEPDMRSPLDYDSKSNQMFLVARQYLVQIDASTATAAAKGRVLTTLVPEVPGMYRDLMEQGQQALMAGSWLDVQKAVDAFSKAQLLTDRNPDVTLSLAHAHFIVARYSYALPSEYLQQTLILLPELPLVQLEPRIFFGSAETYDKRIEILNGYLKEHPDDPDALLMQAYFKWFEPTGAQAAADALRRAWVYAKKPKTLGLGAMTMSNLTAPRTAGSDSPGNVEEAPAPQSQIRVAIDIFWKGMVKSGRVSGSLDQPTVPAPTSRPANPAPLSSESDGRTDKMSAQDNSPQ